MNDLKVALVTGAGSGIGRAVSLAPEVPGQSRRDEAVRWLEQARKDLNAARWLASPEPSRSVFHSQQAADSWARAVCFQDAPGDLPPLELRNGNPAGRSGGS